MRPFQRHMLLLHTNDMLRWHADTYTGHRNSQVPVPQTMHTLILTIRSWMCVDKLRHTIMTYCGDTPIIMTYSWNKMQTHLQTFTLSGHSET